MRKVRSMIYLTLCIMSLSACSASSISEKIFLDALAPESELTITSSDARVSDFLEKMQGFTTYYETDECYNITPDFVADNSDYSVFKFNASTESFILYDGEAYSIGICFGGLGITSMALADLDKDGAYELYYTFSWGSGLHRSHVGYFDPIDKEIHVFEDDALLNSDMMLTVNNSGDLCVNSADLDMDDFVNFTIKAQDFIGTIDFEENQAVFNRIGNTGSNRLS
ncbi:MAG: hypothetical protein NC228_04120 [[Eubacterium] siraeum]|nr:hypothetical protein [[Eubacterium] siraeum]